MSFPVQRLHTGPVLGHTTPTTARVWGRGKVPAAGRIVRGVVRLLLPDATFRDQVFDMPSTLLHAGAVTLTGLTPGTTYAYEVGCFESDAGTPADYAYPAAEMLRRHEFRTPPATSDRLVFGLGSCRRITFADDGQPEQTGDALFGALNQQRATEGDLDLMLLLGDQIYADFGGFQFLTPNASLDDCLRGYAHRYDAAFTTPEAAQLLASVPHAMILDDHELWNDWHRGALRDAYHNTWHTAARRAYVAYQHLHGPAGEGLVSAPADRFAPFDYEFTRGDFRFFVLDTRSERDRSTRPPSIIGAGQMARLLAWLHDHRQAPKFVVTSVPFFPDVHVLDAVSKDRWHAFQSQRNQILAVLRAADVRRTVFVSGDIHTALWATLKDGGTVRAHSIIASPLRIEGPPIPAPLFAAGRLAGSDGFRVTGISGVTGDDNYVRVTASNGDTLRLTVQIMGVTGELERGELTLD